MAEAARSVHQRRDLYSDVTARIIAELERGAAPWVKPWSATPGKRALQRRDTIGPIRAATSSCFGWRAVVAGQRRGS